jgi:hypothetical protein
MPFNTRQAMARVSFFLNERGSPRASTSEADAALASFLVEEAIGEERVAHLLDLVASAQEGGSEVREYGNASALVAKGGRVQIEHDYVGGPVELTSEEFATILKDWDHFVRSGPGRG